MEQLSTVNAGMAFLFGLLSFLSPCVLPLLPGYISFIAGTSSAADAVPSARVAFKNGTGFVLGFSVLFVAMGAAASGLGQWLAANQESLGRLAGVIIIVFGVHISGLYPIPFLYRQSQMQISRRWTGWAGAFVFGLTFAASWTPCVGPVLASILLLAGSTQTLGQGVGLLAFFSLGLAVPFLLAALGIGYIHQWMTKLNHIMPYINAVSGGLLIAMGILLLLGQWDRIVLFFY